MASKVNEIICGEYNHVGKAVMYGDSVVGDSIIVTSQGDMTIADLYELCENNYYQGTKEYGVNSNIQVMGFDLNNKKPIMSNINYVMRHFTTKELFKITLANNLNVTITQDHSIMVIRNNSIIEVKPTDILETDLFISLNRNTNIETIDVVGCVSIERIGFVEDYVYDISINGDNHVFFANDCLVHNTDSVHSETIIRSNWGDLSIESLYNSCSLFWQEETEHGTKEYGSHSDLQVVSYDNQSDQSYYGNINYIYRHKVSKEQWEIEDEEGNKVIVTGDHSVMVERDGILMEITPRDIKDSDILITIL